VYLRAYPQSVRTACLSSVVPIDVATPLTFAKTAAKALESTFSACAADSVCRTHSQNCATSSVRSLPGWNRELCAFPFQAALALFRCTAVES